MRPASTSSPDASSGQPQRDFSSLAARTGNLRQSMRQDYVGMVIFLHLSSELILEMVWFNTTVTGVQSNAREKAARLCTCVEEQRRRDSL